MDSAACPAVRPCPPPSARTPALHAPEGRADSQMPSRRIAVAASDQLRDIQNVAHGAFAALDEHLPAGRKGKTEAESRQSVASQHPQVPRRRRSRGRQKQRQVEAADICKQAAHKKAPIAGSTQPACTPRLPVGLPLALKAVPRSLPQVTSSAPLAHLTRRRIPSGLSAAAPPSSGPQPAPP